MERGSREEDEEGDRVVLSESYLEIPDDDLRGFATCLACCQVSAFYGEGERDKVTLVRGE